MDLDDRAQHLRLLLHDRDSKSTESIDAVYTATSTSVVRTPPQAPRTNAFAERWTGSVHRECTDRPLTSSSHHLEALLKTYANHLNSRRPHRSLRQRPPAPAGGNAAVHRTQLLGDLINEHRNAA